MQIGVNLTHFSGMAIVNCRVSLNYEMILIAVANNKIKNIAAPSSGNERIANETIFHVALEKTRQNVAKSSLSKSELNSIEKSSNCLLMINQMEQFDSMKH